jgi:hypothetical protein
VTPHQQRIPTSMLLLQLREQQAPSHRTERTHQQAATLHMGCRVQVLPRHQPARLAHNRHQRQGLVRIT